VMASISSCTATIRPRSIPSQVGAVARLSTASRHPIAAEVPGSGIVPA
jgi:hypothetical protein